MRRGRDGHAKGPGRRARGPGRLRVAAAGSRSRGLPPRKVEPGLAAGHRGGDAIAWTSTAGSRRWYQVSPTLPWSPQWPRRKTCEYAGLLDLPFLNLVTSVVSMCRLVAKRTAEARARGFACQLLFCNPSVQIAPVALFARFGVGLPLYLQLEDGTHLIQALGL